MSIKTLNEFERHRMRRTLAEVKRKFEEALRLVEKQERKGSYGEPTTTHHRR
ncbi:MAG: hypothetical protein JO199_08675 [Candidatus Eremiobacteraeota bacterium]|nr:hypothetical protein [Candidatus Eremiobacteraeota bacterium]